MQNKVDEIFDFFVVIVAELLFGSGNMSAANMRLVQLALEKLQVRENLEAFLD